MAKFNWEKLLHKTWFYTKVFFAVLALMTATYWWGTYNPNKSAIAKVNEELDVFYMNKIKEMRKIIDTSNLKIRLEVDGGVKEDNIGEISKSGADTFVAGSAIFNKPNYFDAIKNLKNNFS